MACVNGTVLKNYWQLVWQMVVRPSLKRPGMALLNVFSLGLGVSVFLAVQLANRGAFEGFLAAADLTVGRADLEVRGNLDEGLFVKIREVRGVRAASPTVEGLVMLDGRPGEYLRIVGVDPFLVGETARYRLVGEDGGNVDFERWLREPGQVAVMDSWLKELGFGSGQKVRVLTGRGVMELVPAFRYEPEEAAGRAVNRVAIMDIGWAQELLGEVGRLSSVGVVLEDGGRWRDVAAELESLLPGDVVVAPPAARTDEMRTMVSAFQLNLTAMSLVSVVVGMFLIFNSVSGAVVRRQREIAILLSAGCTRGEVRGLFLLEALFEAVVGCAVGILFAPWLAGWAAMPISLTISSLYEAVAAVPAGLSVGQVVLGFGVGVVAALVAAWLPAEQAARVNPAMIMHRGSSNWVFAPKAVVCWVWAGVLLLAGLGCSVGALSGGIGVLGFVSAGCVIAGFTALVPIFCLLTSVFFRRVGGVIWRLAADHFDRSLHRNGVTVAALSAAVAMATAVAVMIHSFRGSVARWVEHTLTADLYVAPAANEGGGLNSTLPREVVEAVRADGRVSEVATFREFSVRVDGRLTSLAVVDGAARGRLEFLRGSKRDAEWLLERGEAVAVSESFVSRFGMRDEVELETPGGVRRFAVCGIYRDFTRDRGVILMAASLHRTLWDDDRVHSLSLGLRDAREAGEVAADLRRKFAAEVLAIYDNAALKSRVFEIFEQTFAITLALRGVAVIVAVVGVVFSLLILVREREREVGVLKSLGASGGQIMGMMVAEAAMAGLTASVCGLACGAVLAMVLTWVVNKAFFGWSIALSYPLEQLLWTPVWVVPAAVAAALLPAWMASRLAPAMAVRFE